MSKYVVIGIINNSFKQVKSKILRWNKWRYNATRYPYYPLGSSGYVVSRPIVEYLVRHMDRLPLYILEDATLGVWLNESPFRDEVVWIHGEIPTRSS